MPTCRPRAAAAAAGRAMASTVVGSMPKVAAPWRASPLNLRTIRLYLSWPFKCLLPAKLEAGKAPNDDIFADPGDRFVQQILDGFAGVTDVRLIEQRHVAVG